MQRNHHRLLQPIFCFGLAFAATFLGQSFHSAVVAQPPPANALRTFGQAAEEAGYTTGTTEIDLSEQSIESLDGIERYTQAVSINLHNNQLTAITPEHLAGLTNLQELDLSWNQLTSLDAGLFNGLVNLQKLGLYGNQLTTLDPGLFDGAANLQRLLLHNNQLISLDAGLFNELDDLQVLILDSNQLTTLDAGLFNGLVNLQWISLSGNQLTALDPVLFDGLNNLHHLSLDENQLSGELNLANLSLQDLHRFSARQGNAITSGNLTGASLSQVALEAIVQDMCSDGVGGLNLSGADLTGVVDYSVLQEWPDLEALTLTDANYNILALDAWLTKLPALQTFTLSQDQYQAIAMAVETNLYTWADDPSHELILVPADE